jgi:hypothetical protein
VQRVVIELAQRRRAGEEARHRRVEVDQRHRFDLRVLENLAHGQAVAAAEHQHTPCCRQGRQPRMDQRFVVAVLVARTELQVVVQMQAQVILPAGDDDALIGRALGMHDVVGVELRFGQ